MKPVPRDLRWRRGRWKLHRRNWGCRATLGGRRSRDKRAVAESDEELKSRLQLLLRQSAAANGSLQLLQHLLEAWIVAQVVVVRVVLNPITLAPTSCKDPFE